MSDEIHRADPKFRRIAPILVLAVAVFGGAAIWALQRWLATHRASGMGDGIDALMMLVAGLVVVLSTVSLGLAFALWQEAARIRQEGRYPPSNMRTLGDVAVRRGPDAGRYATYMRVGAVVAGLAGVGILLWGYRLLRLVA